MTRLIDADKLKIEMMKAFDCEDATKYGNKNAEQQAHSYSTLMLYEISNVVEDCIDNAPTADDWQKYSDELWKNAYEKGKEDIIHSIAEQYSEQNELVPIWLSIGDIRGEKE